MDLLNAFVSARKSGAPLIVVRTTDAADAMSRLAPKAKVTKDENIALFDWDMIEGLQPIADWTKKNANTWQISFGGATANPIELLKMLWQKVPAEGVVFMRLAHKHWINPPVMQGIWNLRDRFKENGRSLVMLVPTGTIAPRELESDITVLDDALPTPAQLREIVKAVTTAAKVTTSEKDLDRAVDALAGLAGFPAEQATSMSVAASGISFPDLWDRKTSAIEQVPGLRVWRAASKFSDLGGNENLKGFARAIIAGEEPPRGIVFMDEIEKQLAGSGTDTSGVSTAQQGKLLSFMSDTDANGVLIVGHPGCAKSSFAKAFAHEAGIPCIVLDMGSLKSGLVGASEERTDYALRTVEAVCQGRALFVGTCNGVANLSTELRRRFTFGTFFSDLPTKEERDAIWKIYIAKPHASAKTALRPEQVKQRPVDTDWTGAEIRQCAMLAWRLRCTLKDAAAYVVPIAVAMPERINKLREEANGRYLSAAEPGFYKIGSSKPLALPDAGDAWVAPGGRTRRIAGGREES